MAEAADEREAMIAEDKDRLECLRLAVVLMTPKAAGVSPKDAIGHTLDAAQKFYKFTRGESNEPRA